jgi:outer membrane protein assembly factor BamD (BamD/ComL family)
MIREAQIYIAPDAGSAKLANITRGREVHIFEKSGQNWVHVVAVLDVSREFGEASHDITGWMLNKGIITNATPNGDKIIFGEAVDSEAEASRRHGRKGAADDARRLYYRVFEYFPQSPLAGEALYRAADIQWQLDKEDVASRPSSKERDPRSRLEINEDAMKQVMKKFPATKWADMAAFHLLDNKLCGDWQAESKCPEKEAEIYLKYADERPKSPNAAEALYNAAYRCAALVEIYKTEEKADKSKEAGPRAVNITQRIVSQYPNTDWSARALALQNKVQNGIPVFGREVD